MKNDLTKGSVLKNLLLFTLPIFGANLLQAMYGTVDLLVVGHFADASMVSAVSTGSMTMQTITGIISGLTTGCTVLLGQNIGRRDVKGSSRTISSAISLFITLGIVLAFFIVMLSGKIAAIMNAPKEAILQTTSYIHICGMGIICIMLFNALGGIFRGIGDSKTPLILMGIACVSNIIGDFILVGGAGLGADGAAIATIAAQGISVVCAIVFIYKKGFGFEISKNNMKPAAFETKTILKYGLPIAAQELLTGVSFMIILAILNGFGLVASAGVGIAEKICALMFLVPGAFMSAISAFSAQNVGAGKYERARAAMKTGAVISTCAGIVMFGVSFFFGDLLSSFFTKENDVIEAAADYLRSYSLDCVIVGVNFSVMGYLNGNGKTAFVAMQGILSTFVVRIPVSYLMSRIAGVTLFQIGLATPLATVFAIVFDFVYLIYLNKSGYLSQCNLKEDFD